MDKLLLTPEEAGNVLSVGRTVVYELMARGWLESVTIGRSRRIPSDALTKFVELLRHGFDEERHPSARMSGG